MEKTYPDGFDSNGFDKFVMMKCLSHDGRERFEDTYEVSSDTS